MPALVSEGSETPQKLGLILWGPCNFPANVNENQSPVFEIPYHGPLSLCGEEEIQEAAASEDQSSSSGIMSFFGVNFTANLPSFLQVLSLCGRL